MSPGSGSASTLPAPCQHSASTLHGDRAVPQPVPSQHWQCHVAGGAWHTPEQGNGPPEGGILHQPGPDSHNRLEHPLWKRAWALASVMAETWSGSKGLPPAAPAPSSWHSSSSQPETALGTALGRAARALLCPRCTGGVTEHPWCSSAAVRSCRVCARPPSSAKKGPVGTARGSCQR